MSTPINMIRRENGSSNDNYPDPKELMRQRLVEPDSNQMSGSGMMQQQQQHQHQPPQQFMSNPMMMGEQQQHPDMDGIMRTDNQLVEDILKEMGESPGVASQANINSQAFGYAMDRAQIPPHKYVDPSSQTDSNIDSVNINKLSDSSNSKGSSFSPSGLMNQISFSLSGQNLKAKVTRNYRYPILVFIICLLLGLPEFNRFLFSFFPKLLLESGQVSLSGVALKALVGMVAFILIGIFL